MAQEKSVKESKTIPAHLCLTDKIIKNALVNGSRHEVHGYNANIGDTLVDIVETGDAVLLTPNGNLIDVLSSSSNDDDGDTGVRTIRIHYLDEDWAEQTTDVTMNGTSRVEVAITPQRINAVHALTVGSNGVAVGNIDVVIRGGNNIYARIGSGGNMSLQCHYTVPAGNVALITGWRTGISTTAVNTNVRATLRATCSWDTRELLSGVFLFQDVTLVQDGTNQVRFDPPIQIPAKCDIKVSAQRVNGSNDSKAAASFTLVHLPTADL